MIERQRFGMRSTGKELLSLSGHKVMFLELILAPMDPVWLQVVGMELPSSGMQIQVKPSLN